MQCVVRTTICKWLCVVSICENLHSHYCTKCEFLCMFKHSMLVFEAVICVKLLESSVEIVTVVKSSDDDVDEKG